MKTPQEIAREHAEVELHFANGGEVEWGCNGNAGDWFPISNPKWDWARCTYRIKEPVDPYAELKAAAKDPTKEISTDGVNWYCLNTRYDQWFFSLPPERYEIRDKPKPMKKVKMLAWFTGGGLNYFIEDSNSVQSHWKRVPSEDKEIEVEE